MLAFNLLLVFLPAAGFLYLDVYEAQLLRAQERSMVQQGRILAAALSDAEAWCVPGCGHNAHLEQPATLAERIASWLAR